MSSENENLRRWRLVLGPGAEDGQYPVRLSGPEEGMDSALEALYDPEKNASLGRSSPHINRWLGDIKKYFPQSVAQVLRRDALDRFGVQALLADPEFLQEAEQDVDLAALLIEVKDLIPEQTRQSAHQVIEKIIRRLQDDFRGKMHRQFRPLHRHQATASPSPKGRPDWPRTIRRNLRHYDPGLGAIIPERIYFHPRQQLNTREVHLLVDQSGSMSSSLVYSGIYGAVIAGFPQFHTRLTCFDTGLHELTEQLGDPVDLLFGLQLGGGTYIGQALFHALNQIQNPEEALVVLISDLFEGGPLEELHAALAQLQQRKVRCLGLLALNDQGLPDYDKRVARLVASFGFPVFACTPDRFPELFNQALRSGELKPEDFPQDFAR